MEESVEEERDTPSACAEIQDLYARDGAVRYSSYASAEVLV